MSRIFIGGLTEDASRSELEREFEYFGSLRDVWVARNPPGFGFIIFEDPRDADDAVREMDGKRVCGTRIRVEYARGPIRGGRGGGARGRNDKCTYCGRFGHSTRECRSKTQGGGGGGSYGGGRRRSRSRSRSNERKRRRRSRSRSNSKSRDRPRRDYRSRSRSRDVRRSRSKDRRSGSGDKRSQSREERSRSKDRKSVSRSRSPSPSRKSRERNDSRSRSRSRSASPGDTHDRDSRTNEEPEENGDDRGDAEDSRNSGDEN